jgi:hypothetical protein
MARTFSARFDSECDECGCDIWEGDEVGWRDGSVVHEDCMEDGE